MSYKAKVKPIWKRQISGLPEGFKIRFVHPRTSRCPKCTTGGGLCYHGYAPLEHINKPRKPEAPQ